MTAADAQTLYDVLEVDPASSLDELRAAVERARETYGPESLAVYALVDEGQLDELRARLDEAAEVLLDPARRASYDRSIGRIGPGTLWAEDDEDDEEALPPLAPDPRSLELEAEASPDGADPEDEAAEAPRQHALALEVADTPGPFGRGPEPSVSPPLLSADWAAAVPPEQLAETPARVEPVARVSPEVVPEPAGTEAAPVRAAEAPAEAVPEERAAPRPSLGLRVKPPPAPAAPEPEPEPAPAPPEATAAPPPERHREPAPRGRESRLKLDLPSDAEFNGELLRRVRESYGLSLQQVAERTRITRIHLENVEADRYDRLPATVYLRGILVNLARELRLDPARVSKTYLLAAQRSTARVP